MKKYLLNIVISLFLFSGSMAAVAKEAEAALTPEIISAILSNGRSVTGFQLNQRAKALDGVTIPDSWQLIGAFIPGPTMQVTYFKALGTPKATTKQVSQLLANQGFNKVVESSMAQVGGFVVSGGGGPGGGPERYCHKSKGYIYPKSVPLPSATMVSLHTSEFNQYQSSCKQDRQGYRSFQRSPLPLPTLTLPQGAAPAAGTGFGGRSSSNNRTSTEMTIQTNNSKPSLLSHFSPQMQTQGWSLDSDWSSKSHSGSVWLKTDDKGKRYLCELVLLQLKDDTIELAIATRLLL